MIGLVIGSMTEDLEEGKHRLILSDEGDEKSGKTEWSLTAPDPIAYFNIDRDNRRLLRRMRKRGQKIVEGRYTLPGEDNILRVSDSATIKMNAEAARVEKKRFRQDLYLAAKDTRFRTLVFDNGGHFWALYRMAAFGKLLEIPPLLYSQVNCSFLYDFIGMPRKKTDKNVIIIHRLKDKYERGGKGGKGGAISETTGEREIIGHKEVPAEVDASIRVWRERKGERLFHATIHTCGPDGSLEGLDFTSAEDECDFPTVAARIWGDKPEKWMGGAA